MEIPVLIEPIRGNGYIARTGSPFDWSAEGETAEEALRKLREEVARRLAGGSRVAPLQVSLPTSPGNNPAIGASTEPVPPSTHPWRDWVGKWAPDDPIVQEWKEAVEEYRREVENTPERL